MSQNGCNNQSDTNSNKHNYEHIQYQHFLNQFALLLNKPVLSNTLRHQYPPTNDDCLSSKAMVWDYLKAPTEQTKLPINPFLINLIIYKNYLIINFQN